MTLLLQAHLHVSEVVEVLNLLSSSVSGAADIDEASGSLCDGYHIVLCVLAHILPTHLKTDYWTCSNI